jgi:hypothetical protein
VVWRTIIVRLAACTVPPAAPISAPQAKKIWSAMPEAGSIGIPNRLSRSIPTITRQTRISTTMEKAITGFGP